MIRKKFALIMILILLIYSCKVLINNNVIAENAKDSYKILVDVEESRLYVFKNEELYKTYKCAGGKSGTPSPIGTWKITNKGKWGKGFGGYWMRI